MKQGSERTPRTTAELDVLKAHRQVLAGQLDEVTARRGRLGQERLNAQARGDQDMVQEYTATITELGTRMKRLQREHDAAEERIADAVARGIGQDAVSQTRVITLPGGQSIGIGGIGGIKGIGGIGGFGGGSLLPPPDLTALHNTYRRMMVAEAVGFILLGAIVARFVWQRARRSGRSGSGGDASGLRTAIESIAIEVERISENQRYVTKLLTEGAAIPLAPQSADPVAESGAKRGTPERR